MAQQQVQPSQISANNTTSGQVLVSNGTVASWGTNILVSDTSWKYRLVRCDFEGNNNDTSTVNYAGYIPTGLSNGATISNTLAKFGSSSLLCAGGAAASKPQCQIPMLTNIGTANFTLECWVYPTSFTNNTFPAVFDLAASTTSRVAFYFTSGTAAALRLDATSNALTIATIGVTLNAWNHIAVERVGTTLTLYVNGVSAASFTYATAILNTWTLYVGSTLDGYPLAGNIDDLRLTIGSTVYGAAFSGSLPSAAFPIGPYGSLGNGPIL